MGGITPARVSQDRATTRTRIGAALCIKQINSTTHVGLTSVLFLWIIRATEVFEKIGYVD